MKPRIYLILSLLIYTSQVFGWTFSDHTNKRELKILVFGDSGWGNQNQYNVGASMAHTCRLKKCDLALMLGDNFYLAGIWSVNDPKLKSHFEAPYREMQYMNFWAALGNHDYLLGDRSVEAEIQYTQYSPMWRMPARNYAVPGLPPWMKIYVLDTVMIDPVKLYEMKQYFCSAPGAWKVLIGHYPTYSQGKHGSHITTRNWINPIIKDCGVHYYLAGHDHHLEHISTGLSENFVIGSAAEVRGVRVLPYNGNQFPIQRFAQGRLGYGVLSLNSTQSQMELFNDVAEPVYRMGRNIW